MLFRSWQFCILHISYINCRFKIGRFTLDAVYADITTAALNIMNDIPIFSDIIVDIFFQSVRILFIIFLKRHNKSVKCIKIATKHLQCIFYNNTVREIRGLDGEEYKRVPIVALSENNVESNRDEIVKEGFSDVLVKPLEMDGIERVFRLFLPEEKIKEKTSNIRQYKHHP